jgi:glutamate synthase (NADPH/NADH) small chain
MAQSVFTSGVVAGRLSPEELGENFSDLHAPLDDHEAAVAADRCYFCHDAPCTTACPTDIDIPLFIREISTGMPDAAAKTIFSQNIMGGMCARVCPTETLCEEVCVREVAEGKPVIIGQLQRYATDKLIAKGSHPFERAPETGKSVAVVGAGPAGLSCAHRLAMLGHSVTVFDNRDKAGGLNEYGIASYKSTGDFAQAEVNWLLSIGGITLKNGETADLADLQKSFDAVFLGMGLGGVNALRAEGETLENVVDAVDFIAELRQSDDLSKLPIGRRVVVIGGGMTAVDAAVQAKLLGAQEVVMAYRRGKEAMSASEYEQDLAASKGVHLVYNAAPVRLLGDGAVNAVEFAYTQTVDGKLVQTGETFTVRADQVFKAIGQTLLNAPEGLTIEGGKITVNETGQTTLAGVWAGGDCASGGDDLTVTAVAEGRDAAEDIHASLTR